MHTDDENYQSLSAWAHQQDLEQQEWEETTMALWAENKGGQFEMAPEGTHIARCYRLIDLGTHFSTYYNKSAHKIRLYWELPTETMKDGKPFMVSKSYTLSFHEKSGFRHHIEAWRGRKFTGEEAARFDVTKIIGQCCLLNIAHVDKNGSIFAEITSLMALPKGTECPPQINPSFIFDLSVFDERAFGTLSQKMQDKIKLSSEYKMMKGEGEAMGVQAAPDFDDDIPF